MSTEEVSGTPAKSTFVTVVAWIFIVLSAFFCMISLLQNVMVHMMFSGPEMDQAFSQAGDDEVPAFVGWMFSSFRVIVGVMLGLGVATLAASIGLLQRRNWARLMFIAILGLGIVWNLGGLVVQLWVMSSAPVVPADAPDDFQAGFQVMSIMIGVFSGLIAVATAALFAWLIKRLVSPGIRREFQSFSQPQQVG